MDVQLTIESMKIPVESNYEKNINRYFKIHMIHRIYLAYYR